MKNWDNHKIVKGCINFDSEARRILYELYSTQMYSVCLRYVKDENDANDVFQEGFYLVFKNMKQLRDPQALAGWIKRIFVNVAIEHQRKKYQLRVVEDGSLMESYANSDINQAIGNMATEEITTLIRQLPTGCQQVFNLYVIDGYSHKEIADMMGISVGTSKSQLHDARKLLKWKITTLVKSKNTGN